MTSKTARRKARKKRGATIITGTGKRQNPAGRKPAEDPRKTALEARARMAGLGDRNDAASPLHSCDVGRCIMACAPADQHMPLWGTWCAILAALENWRTRNTGQTGHAKCATIAAVPDRVETDQSLRVDVRTADERDRDAKAAALRWDELIRRLPPQYTGILRGARDGFMVEGALWFGGAPTDRGRLLVKAIERAGA